MTITLSALTDALASSTLEVTSAACRWTFSLVRSITAVITTIASEARLDARSITTLEFVVTASLRVNWTMLNRVWRWRLKINRKIENIHARLKGTKGLQVWGVCKNRHNKLLRASSSYNDNYFFMSFKVVKTFKLMRALWIYNSSLFKVTLFTYASHKQTFLISLNMPRTTVLVPISCNHLTIQKLSYEFYRKLSKTYQISVFTKVYQKENLLSKNLRQHKTPREFINIQVNTNRAFNNIIRKRIKIKMFFINQSNSVRQSNRDSRSNCHTSDSCRYNFHLNMWIRFHCKHLKIISPNIGQSIKNNLFFK